MSDLSAREFVADFFESFTREVVAGTIVPRGRTTVYTRYGDVFARATLGAALVGLLAVGLARGASAMRVRPRAPVVREPS